MDIYEINRKLIDIQHNIIEKQLPINYKTIEMLCLKMVNFEIKETTDYSYINYGSMINIVYDFFRSININLYKQATKVMTDNQDIMVYNRNNIDPKDYTKYYDYNDELLLFDEAGVHKLDDRVILYLPYYNNTKDIFTFSHEISHTFDIHAYDTTQRKILTEITPFILEKKLVNYLIDNGYKTDAVNYKNIRMNSCITTAKKALPIVILSNAMNNKRGLTYENLKNYILSSKNICKTYLLNEYNYDDSINNILDNIKNKDIIGLNGMLRYMIAQAVATHFYENYDQDKFNYYISSLGNIRLNKSLDLLGVRINRCGECLNADEISNSVLKNHGDEVVENKKLIYKKRLQYSFKPNY